MLIQIIQEQFDLDLHYLIGPVWPNIRYYDSTTLNEMVL